MLMSRARRQRPARSRTSRDGVALTLTDEHALLLGQVSARAADLLTAAAEDRWPRQELQSLLGYLRAEVLRQVVDEERLLFPPHPTPPGFARLRRDHVRLRHCTETLAEAAGGEPGWTPAQLTRITLDLLTQLERHLAAEEALLATARAPRPVLATAVLTGRPHEWYPLTEGPVIELDALPASQVIDAAVDRLLRLCRGERVELHSSRDLNWVWRRMDRLAPAGYGFVYLHEGPRRWAMQVTRRPVT